MSINMAVLAKELERLAIDHASRAGNKNLHGFEALVESAVAKALLEVANAVHRTNESQAP